MSSNMVPTGGTMGFPAIFAGPAHTVATSGTSQQVTMTGNPSLLKVYCAEDSFLAFGINPVASSSTNFHAGGTTDYYGIQPGQKIAVIQSTTTGACHITEAL